MNHLERDPTVVLDRIGELAQEIGQHPPLIGASSPQLDQALEEVKWLQIKAVWFKGEGYSLERINYLRRHLQALAGDGHGHSRQNQLQMALSEVGRLRMWMRPENASEASKGIH
jgi:hypothetical protein